MPASSPNRCEVKPQARKVANGGNWIELAVVDNRHCMTAEQHAKLLARKPRRTYQPRVVGDQVMMPADLKRLHE
jgi:hypothetical protein